MIGSVLGEALVSGAAGVAEEFAGAREAKGTHAFGYRSVTAKAGLDAAPELRSGSAPGSSADSDSEIAPQIAAGRMPGANGNAGAPLPVSWKNAFAEQAHRLAAAASQAKGSDSDLISGVETDSNFDPASDPLAVSGSEPELRTGGLRAAPTGAKASPGAVQGGTDTRRPAAVAASANLRAGDPLGRLRSLPTPVRNQSLSPADAGSNRKETLQANLSATPAQASSGKKPHWQQRPATPVPVWAPVVSPAQFPSVPAPVESAPMHSGQSGTFQRVASGTAASGTSPSSRESLAALDPLSSPGSSAVGNAGAPVAASQSSVPKGAASGITTARFVATAEFPAENFSGTDRSQALPPGFVPLAAPASRQEEMTAPDQAAPLAVGAGTPATRVPVETGDARSRIAIGERGLAIPTAVGDSGLTSRTDADRGKSGATVPGGASESISETASRTRPSPESDLETQPGGAVWRKAGPLPSVEGPVSRPEALGDSRLPVKSDGDRQSPLTEQAASKPAAPVSPDRASAVTDRTVAAAAEPEKSFGPEAHPGNLGWNGLEPQAGGMLWNEPPR
jgi:hypothetical protein